MQSKDQHRKRVSASSPKMRKVNIFAKTMVLLLLLVGLKICFESEIFEMSYALIHLPKTVKPLRLDCQDVLKNMVYGRWETRPLSRAEDSEIKLFNDQVRKEKGMPGNLQRPDKLCGNVTFPKVSFRALCDPNGETPCCYNNACTNRTVDQCTCANCYDTRRPVDAEYATWRPWDPTCQLQQMSQKEICQLLDGATVYFIGDSLVRHVYTAFLLAARNNEISGAMAAKTPASLRSSCAGLYMFTEKVCRLWVDPDPKLCNNTVRAKLLRYYNSGYASSIHNDVVSLANVSRSIVFIGIGLHDGLNSQVILQRLLLPLVTTMNSSRMTHPKLVWLAIHALSLLSSPNYPWQRSDAILQYNKIIGEFLSEHQVPAFETFNLTDGAASFDGVHFGLGVNRVKVQILLNYLLELREKQSW